MNIMPSPRSTALFATLLGGLSIGCGTQIGNPTGSGALRVTGNPASLGTLVNAAFLQTIDGMNMGDYAYSRLESRVSTDRRCQTEAGSGISLLGKAETRHAVIDESSSFYAKSDLTIKRSYEDAWTQNGVLLACDPSSRSIRFQYERLQLGPIKLESRVNEDLARSLLLTAKQDQQELRHSLSLRKSGRRSLEFVNYSELGREVILEAQLNNQLESAIDLPRSDGLEDGSEKVTLQLQERFPLNFVIALDHSRQWTRYVIANGRQEFIIPSSGETLRLDFRNLTFTREGACVPVSGQMAATIVRPGEGSERYSLNFQPNASLIMKSDSGIESLMLAPFACVLKER
jgi:hypothetical protein